MIKRKNHILSIAGFDPSGGAGILADIKSFEKIGGLGMAVQTANTIQNESEFISVNWTDQSIIKAQLAIVLDKYPIKTIKIGLIESIQLLEELVDICLFKNTKIKIIWDPVLSASAGFKFNQNLNDLENVLAKLYLITPNWNEIKELTNQEDEIKGATTLSKYCNVLLKGGHNPENLGRDYLFKNEGQKIFNPKQIKYYPKHGSGCIFSSAIAAHINKGHSLNQSILKSKRYIEKYLTSSKSLLGHHNI